MKHMPVGVSVVYCITWDPYSIPKSLSGAKNMMVIFGRPLRSVELRPPVLLALYVLYECSVRG